MRLLGIAMALALLASCTSQDSPERETPTQSSDSPAATTNPSVIDGLPTKAEAIWSVQLRAFGNPVPVGDTLVVVVEARQDELDIVGLDRATGDVRWRWPFLATSNVDGLFLGDLVYASRDGGAHVVFQLAERGGALDTAQPRPYVAIDPVTGDEAGRTRPVTSRYGPVECADGHDACLRLTAEPRGDTRWNLDTFRLEQEPSRFPAGANALSDNSDVYIVSGQVEGYAAATAIGRVGAKPWRTPATKVTKTRNWLVADNDGFVDINAGVAVVELTRRIPAGAQRRYDRGELVLLDQNERRTVGLDLMDGHVLWRHDGSDFTCLELSRSTIPVR